MPLDQVTTLRVTSLQDGPIHNVMLVNVLLSLIDHLSVSKWCDYCLTWLNANLFKVMLPPF